MPDARDGAPDPRGRLTRCNSFNTNYFNAAAAGLASGTGPALAGLVARLSLSLLASAGQAREISGALRALARRARRDRGCLSSEVYESVDDQNRLFLQAEWTDPDALARYVRSDDFGQVLTLMEMAAEQPVLEFRLAGEVRGLDYVAELRRDPKPTTT